MLKRTEIIALCNQVIAESDFDRRHELLHKLVANLVEFTNKHGLPDFSSTEMVMKTAVNNIDLTTVSDQVFPLAIMRNCMVGSRDRDLTIAPQVIRKDWSAFVAQWHKIISTVQFA